MKLPFLNRVQSERQGVSRRTFLIRSASVASFSLVPSHVVGLGVGAAPSNRLNIACIGVGGRGQANINGILTENIVALCDVDTSRAAKDRQRFTQARFFQDYRIMLETLESSIDAVVVATPDHTHAVAAMMAIQQGKHVYCEKPLAHSLFEARSLTEAARNRRVATQLGNQGHSSDSIRQFCEMIWTGAIGTVREVHAWVQHSYRPQRYRVRPSENPAVPPTLNWNLWLGPAPARPYHPAYHPGSWRGWVDFGTGIIGDWTCHVLDPVFWALELGAPHTISAQVDGYQDPRVRAETVPAGYTLVYEFPQRENRPPVTVKWFTGTHKPPRPQELEPNRQMPGIGALVIGDQGKILYGSHGAAAAQLIPSSHHRAYQKPPRTLSRSKGHHADWILACKGGKPASSNFDYGGPLTEVALLGALALRMKGQSLEWDSAQMKVRNLNEANRFVTPPYRSGWQL